MKRRKRHWYHLSEQDHGERWVARRITPENCGATEPKTPRLCVAATIARCLSAKAIRGRAWIYQTARPRAAIDPGDSVWDSIITRERWLVPPVEMVRVGTLEPEVVQSAMMETLAYVRQHKCCSWRQRIRALRDAIETLEMVEPQGDIVYVNSVDRQIIDLARQRNLV